MRLRTSCSVALALALVGLAAWRAVCVASGPDIDTDAYAHHMIARGILADPRDLAIHWVWLPLFHYLQVPLVALGGTMDHVRWINVALSACLPVVLFGYVRRTTRLAGEGAALLSPDVVALLASLFAAASPIAMQMGTTAQPEPLFALLMLGVAITFAEKRYTASGAILGAAVMLRYEAWAALAAAGALVTAEWIRRRVSGSVDGRDGARALRMLVLPVVLIAAWASLRRPVDGRWFAFLGQTREFANAVAGAGRAFAGPLGVLRDGLYYPVFVAARVLGPVVLLVPFGVARTLRQQGRRFVVVLGACLWFISFSWVTRASLGLDRHFVVVVPLYATFAAQGAAVIADGVARRLRGATGDLAARALGRAVGATAAAFVTIGLVVELQIWMGDWQGSIQRGWPDRVATGAFLRSISGDATIFCDDATVEILSGLDRHRFDRHWVDDPHTWELIASAAQTRRVAYVATWSRKLIDHEEAGTVVFRPGPATADRATGLAVMRVSGGGAGAQR